MNCTGLSLKDSNALDLKSAVEIACITGLLGEVAVCCNR